jgi:hypothetical protein
MNPLALKLLKKQFCGSVELENVSNILNIDNSDRAKAPAKFDNQSGSSTQVNSAVHN